MALCYILDEKQRIEGPLFSVLDILISMNRVSGGLEEDMKPLWLHPGIPCLLESLMRLFAAEKVKCNMYNNCYLHTSSYCWQNEAKAAIRLVDLAVSDLVTNPCYEGAQLDKIAIFIRQRAIAIRDLSDNDAKKCPNYWKVNGNPSYLEPHGWRPNPEYIQVKMVTASYNKINFEKELRMLMQESGATSVFKKFLEL